MGKVADDASCWESAGYAPGSFYIDTVGLNGKPHPASWFRHADIIEGGRFVLRMRKDSATTFGQNTADRPVSALDLRV